MSQYGDVPLFWVLFGVAPGFLSTFLGYSKIFGYHFFGYSRIFGYHFFGKNLISFGIIQILGY